MRKATVTSMLLACFAQELPHCAAGEWQGQAMIAGFEWVAFDARQQAGKTAHAADRMVTLTRPMPLARYMAAVPRIAHPRDAAERRINAALGGLDSAARQAASACRGKDQGWQRAVRVTMRGPGYLSYEVADAFDCGTAHPENGTYTVVYDLHTGQTVDWTTLLPRALTGVVSLKPGADGTRTASLDSPELRPRFLAAQQPQVDPGDAAQCARVLAFAVPTGMRAWLDGPAGALAVQPNMPHGADACARPLLLPAAELRQLGAAPALADALDAARTRRLNDGRRPAPTRPGP